MYNLSLNKQEPSLCSRALIPIFCQQIKFYLKYIGEKTFSAVVLVWFQGRSDRRSAELLLLNREHPVGG